MKRILFFILVLFFSLTFQFCTDNPTTSNLPENLEGAWVFQSFENETYTMQKSYFLEKDNSGFIFFNNGKFVERKNSGWCGTPPVTYTNFSGNWKSETEKKLNINVGYWGGTESYTIEIIFVSSSNLMYKRNGIY